MKKFILHFTSLSVILLLMSTMVAIGQQLVPLANALDLFGKSRNVKFVYEQGLVQNLLVNYQPRALPADTEEALKEILQNTGLIFNRISKDYFTLVKAKVKGSVKGIFINGYITDAKSGKPLEGVSVGLTQLGLSSMTDANGFYVFKDLLPGTTTVRVQFLTAKTQEKELVLEANKEYSLNFELEENVLSLKEVVVVATESKAGNATSSLISKTAIEHLQATSLNDVLQLLPGALAGNPDFSNVNRAAIRQLNANNMGSLGTAVLVNGIPLSNNANLQVMNPASAGANASFSTSTGSGTDLRQISADNIESVEVIRGVPSVEYGDLTNGAILVKTKAGVSPLQLKARINPVLTQLWAGQGFDLGKNRGYLNADLDYTKAYTDQRYSFDAYSRVTGSLLYTKSFFKAKPLATTTGFSYAMNLDEQKQDPDDVRTFTQRRAQDYAYRFNTSGKWNLNQRFARMLNYSLSANYTVQKGFQQDMVSNYIYPMSTATTDITMVGQYVPTEYLSQVWIEGKPLNIFAKLSNNFYLKSGGFNHRFLMGLEWRTDVNFGSGKTFDVNRPPRLSGNDANRLFSYKDIPALHQLSAYVEDNISGTLFNRSLNIQAGLRYDNVQPTGPWGSDVGKILAPRINLSYEIIKRLNLRAGYGITAKAPTLLYLYPQNAYFDLLNLNYYSENPAERLVIVTTRVYDSKNANLKIATNNKAELGFDFSFLQNKRLTVTAYSEKIKNGYSFNTTFESVKMVGIDQYGVSSTPVGQPPVLNPVPVSVQRYALTFNTPDNNIQTKNKGLEFDLDMGRFDAIRTSFVFNGACMDTRTENTSYYILARQTGANSSGSVPFYAQGRGNAYSRASTTLRIIHNIPQVRLIVTLAAQTIWRDQNDYIGYESLPVGLISMTTGQRTWLTEAERNSSAIVNNPDLNLNVQPQYAITESWKPLWLFNLRLTKEMGKAISFSFFANNVLMDRPLEESTRWSGQFSRRNPTLFFGSELSIKF
ncbi:TonB-dependent receptor [Pedobacter sp. MC2016-14]|uniref:TonB-dependent receptor n=1 Tax=Pedobacter sp. MC2016-14 TaxID=2897327 RepID=UPI001E2FA65F|nr:TonB-dependent receptor [Pedobacter sp. MC2016-14]MCD0489827.1 TonB-dependent receptor [Pedobacter sp. MC2016-14]